MDPQVRNRHYQASDMQLIIIANLIYKLKRDSYICDFILLVFTTILYNTYAKDLPTFIGGEIAVILLVAFVQYKLVSGKGRFINATAVNITISTGYITIKTAAFTGPLWFRRKSIEIQMPKAGTKLFQLNTPYPQIFRGSRQALKLENMGREVYVLIAYFEPRLEEELRGG